MFQGDKAYAEWLLNSIITVKTIKDFTSEQEVIKFVNDWLSKDSHKKGRK